MGTIRRRPHYTRWIFCVLIVLFLYLLFGFQGKFDECEETKHNSRGIQDQDGLRTDGVEHQDGLRTHRVEHQDGLRTHRVEHQDGLRTHRVEHQDGLRTHRVEHQDGLRTDGVADGERKRTNRKHLRDVGNVQHYAQQYRRISNNIQEFWNYINAELSSLKTGPLSDNHAQNIGGVVRRNHVDTGAVARILEMASQYKRSLLSDMRRLQDLEGGARWAETQNRRVGDLVQARLRHVQNPPDCSAARKVSCRINWPCGFGCQLHHLSLCLLIGYATNRTLVLDSRDWNYDKQGGWENFFEPLSETCRSVAKSASVTYWPDYDPSKDVIELKSQTYRVGPGFRPRAIPQDIAESLVHGEPIVWWVGQFIRYIFRPNNRLRQLLTAHTERIRFEHPIVGVHIRRTDKIGTEASAHSVSEYMRHVVEYYEQLSLSANNTRRVYVATDEPTVIETIRRDYPGYVILGDDGIASTASLDSRYTTDGLLGIITDLYFFSQTDFLVCTFSSQICRVAYELRNALGPGDYSRAFRSLDDIWFFAGGSAHVQVAVLAHSPTGPGEIALRPGDRLLPAGNHWNGYCLGSNNRTGERGLYPAFKVESLVETYDGFPTYPEVLGGNDDVAASKTRVGWKRLPQAITPPFR